MAAGRYIVIVLALLLASCSREVVREIDMPVVTKKVPVSFKVKYGSGNSAKTRAGWEYDGYFPGITDEEKKISNILIIAFKSFILEEYTWFDESDFTGGSQGVVTLSGDDEEEDNVLNLDPGAYYFYVMINTPDDLKTRVNTLLENGVGSLDKDTFERQVMAGVTLDYLTGDGSSFFMTNSSPPVIRGIFSEEQIAGGSGLNNNVTIEAGRTVAKISLAYVADQVETGEVHGSLSDIEYRVVHNPVNMFLMPVVENNVLITPHYGNAFDKEYFKPQVSEVVTNDGKWLRATTDPTTPAADMDYAYCIENSNLTPFKQGNSTMLLVRAKFTPTIWLDGNGYTSTANANGTFWRIMRTTKSNVDLDYEPGYYNEEPAAAYLTAEYDAGTYRTVKFEDGTCYYGFWLEYNDRLMAQRNSYYKVAITHVHGSGGLGKDDIIDPGENTEGSNTWGRTSIIDTKWDEYTQEEILGSDDEN